MFPNYSLLRNSRHLLISYNIQKPTPYPRALHIHFHTFLQLFLAQNYLLSVPNLIFLPLFPYISAAFLFLPPPFFSPTYMQPVHLHSFHPHNSIFLLSLCRYILSHIPLHNIIQGNTLRVRFLDLTDFQSSPKLLCICTLKIIFLHFPT